MTAQGEDLLAWLDGVITAREGRAALAAVSLAGSSNGAKWEQLRDERHSGYMVRRPALRPGATTPPWTDATGEKVALVFGESEAAHVIANDPASVLRRCAADRKLIALHNVPSVVFPDSGHHEGERRCVGCGFGSDEEPMVNDVNDCPVLNYVAEGYGWTEGE